MSALDKIKEFEKASKVKQPTMEEQRQRARFDSRKSKFERNDSADFGSQRKTSDVMRKARDIIDLEAAAEREKDAKARRESFDKTRKGFASFSESVDEPEEVNGGGRVQASLLVFEENVDLEEQERRRQEEEEAARRRKEDFKNKAMMFQSV